MLYDFQKQCADGKILANGKAPAFIKNLKEKIDKEHLGYKKNDNAGDNSGNSRNGYTTKTVITDDNDTIEV